jgi:hypothetical protein
MVPYSALLGYKKGEDGNLAIDETEAPIVRRIYARFLQGATPQTIAKELTADQIPTPRGKQIWSPSTVRSILANEKYKGDALLQKSFTTDFLTKTMKVNEGEVPQYYVTGNHEPIINPDTWDAVQAELARRAGKGTSNTHPFANTIKCADCGGSFGRKVWHSTSKYRRYIWRCNNKYGKIHRCATPHVTEDQIKDAFVAALTERVTSNDVLDDTMRILDETIYNTRDLETRQTKLGERIEETITLMNQLITTAAATAHDPDDYDHRYHELENRHHQLEAEHQQIICQIDDLRHCRAQAIKVHDYLATQPPLAYSDQAWNTLVDHATVTVDGTIDIQFKA